MAREGFQHMKVVTVEQMRALERAADAGGLSYATMMENAGRAVAGWLERRGVRDKRVLVLVGPGNNGGDGLVAAYYLQQAGARVQVYCLKREVAGDVPWERVAASGISAIWRHEDARSARLRRAVTQSDYVVDALLGTGASRPINGALLDTLRAVTKALAASRRSRSASPFVQPASVASPGLSHTPTVIAVDVPSGLDCDTGAVDSATLPASVTITFGFPKVGQFLCPGAAAVGELVVADIGIPERLARDIPLEVTTPGSLRAILPKRPLDAHKGTSGKALIVAGSANYSGAPYLAAAAAMRVGAGLATLAVPELLHPILATKLSEATFLLLPHQMGALVPEAVAVLQKRMEGYDALLLGPGLGSDPQTIEFVARLLHLPRSERRSHLGFVDTAGGASRSETRLPALVIDADGLNALADTRGWQSAGIGSAVLTPHPGEMARLLQTSVAEVNANRLKVALKAAQEWGVVVVLKGAYTVVAAPDGRECINPFAVPALATAGTGDVLAGVIVGLLAQGLEPFDAAVAGTYLHGLAGRIAGEEVGPTGTLASDLLDRLPLCLRQLSAA